jgi:hypothetical protein
MFGRFSHMPKIEFGNFLGVDEVESKIGSNFSDTQITNGSKESEPYLKKNLLVNLAPVTMFDVGGLLLLLVWLESCRASIGNLKFKLPDLWKSRKARDFLKKWRFDRALKYAFNDDLTNLLVDDQLVYFQPPLEYYTDARLFEEYGDLSVLKSHNLLEILPLTEITESGNSRVSKARINEVADSLSLKSVIPIIQSAVGANSVWSSKFGRTLVYQALLNAFEHPEATVAFLAIAKKPNPEGRGARLVIAVVDNGVTISDTIHDAFINDTRVDESKKLSSESPESQYQIHSNKIVYATWESTSRKPINHPDPERGMGLYYLKTMTTEVKGETIIRCRNASVRFKGSESPGKIISEPRKVQHLEKGNLIRISIPIEK